MKHTFTCLSFLSLLLFSITRVNAQSVDKNDSLALVDLYNATEGNAWTNHDIWLTQSPVCTWHGITVSCNRVTGIDLSGNNLSGMLPSSIGNLAGLQNLYLYNNTLNGSLPSSFFQLINLKELLLGSNFFSGAIPSLLGKLTALQQLDLSNNQFNHSIPVSIGSLVNAEYINLNHNQLSGRIPVTIGKLANVRILEMAENELTGAIPAEIGKLAALRYLHMQNNKLSGALPSSIGKLQSLEIFYADNNRLSGPLTDAVGHATNLQLLSLSGNQLSGIIPSSLGNLSNLVHLYLNNNELRGTIPPAILKMTNLQYLYLGHNHLSQETNRKPMLPLNLSLHADISYNDFTFNGLEILATNYPFLDYSPQATLAIHAHDDRISLSAGGTLNNNSYVWFKAEDGSYSIVHGDSLFRPASAGHYYAWVRNIKASQLILYTDTIEYKMPVDNSKLITSVSRVEPSHPFLIYPNPARDIVHIRTEENAVIMLADINGKILLSKTVNRNDIIDVSHLSAGTYYLQNRTTGETKKMAVVH